MLPLRAAKARKRLDRVLLEHRTGGNRNTTLLTFVYKSFYRALSRVSSHRLNYPMVINEEGKEDWK